MDATWTAPKNIRQIGETNAHYSIYIEDYVSTYIAQFAREIGGACAQGLLLGQVIPEDEKTVYVIRGILTDQETYPSRDLLFAQEALEELHRQKEQYFPDIDVIGEVIFDKEYKDSLAKMFIDTVRLGQLAQSAGIRHLVLHMDYSDKTMSFCIGNQGAIEIVESYYIFYDKNEAMQNYLINYNEEAQRRVEEIHDVISSQARAAMESPHKARFRLEKENVMTGVVCTLLVCVALLGIVHINQYQKMHKLEAALDQALAFFSSDTQTDVPVSANAHADGGQAEDPFSDLPIYAANTGENGQRDDVKDNAHVSDPEQVDANMQVGQDNAPGTAPEDGTADTRSDKPDGSQGGDTAGSGSGGNTETGDGASDGGVGKDGQTGEMPADVSPHREYVVQKGDTLTSISLLFYKDSGMIDRICQLNGIEDADRISIGQKILLP